MDSRLAVKQATEIAQKFATERRADFIEQFVKIEDKDSEEIIVPFLLWPKQKELLDEWDHSRLNVVIKARQLGITWLALAYALTECIGKPTSVIMFSRTEEEAKELIRRMGVQLSHMRGLCADAKDKTATALIRYEAATLKIVIHLPDGRQSTVQAFASAGGAARSFTANIIIFDEWAFQLRAREIWASAFPTINRPSGGKVIGISTIDRGTLFEDLVIEPERYGFKRCFIPWNADPRRDEAWYEQTRKALGDLIMQEYPATVEEALTVPGGAFFPMVKELSHVRQADYQKNRFYYISLDYGLDMLSIKWIWINPEGKCRVFREYDMPNLIISEACREINRHMEIDGRPQEILAPPDLWSREQLTGKSRALIFMENGVDLVSVSNDREDGCAALLEMLMPGEDGEPELTFDECCPRVYSDLRRIQKDEKNPNVYAVQPHELTHSVDALRYFAVWWKRKPKVQTKQKKTELELFKERLERKGRRRAWL